MSAVRLVVVVPFLNEERYLGELLASIAGQTRPPDRLLLVDDGSTDGSAPLADAFAAEHAYARVLRRPPRPPVADRLADAPEWQAFQWALAEGGDDYDVVAKLDGDLRLTPETFAEIERRFAADERLGIAGAFLAERDAQGVLVRHHCPGAHVEGATKFYRRACFEDIAPVPAILGWDTIDEVRARMHGWTTQSFPVPTGDPEHLRRMGSHDGIRRGFRRAGAAAWAYGSHPLHVLLSAGLRLRERPLVLCGVSYVAGWAGAARARAPRADRQERRFVRREQWARVGAALRPRTVDRGTS